MERYPGIGYIKDHDLLERVHTQIIEIIHRRMGLKVAGITCGEIYFRLPDQVIKCTGIHIQACHRT
jgi:hypothetical protein